MVSAAARNFTARRYASAGCQIFFARNTGDFWLHLTIGEYDAKIRWTVF